MGHAELELPVLGGRALERLDPAEERADVADEQAARVVLVPEVAVHLDARLERLDAEVLGCGPDVCEASEAVLRPAVGVADHAGVETRPGHDREVLAVHLPEVELPLLSREPDWTASPMSSGIPRFDANRFAVPAGRIASVASGACHGVDAALHHAVAAPGEDRLGAVRERLLDSLRRVLALGNLGPERIRSRRPAPAPCGAPRARRPSTCPRAR